MITPEHIQATYDKRAGVYDLSTRLYPLIGFRFERYRRRGLDRLDLRPGDVVVDLGCGTGLNFKPILDCIGAEGRLIGVDVSACMLARARKRVEAAGWTNVDFVQASMEPFHYPPDVTRIFTSGALGFAVDPGAIIQRAAHVLPEDGSMVIVDLKFPTRWPTCLFHFYFTLMGKPFAVTPTYVKHKPWQDLESAFETFSCEEKYGGAIYIASGTRPKASYSETSNKR